MLYFAMQNKLVIKSIFTFIMIIIILSCNFHFDTEKKETEKNIAEDNETNIVDNIGDLQFLNISPDTIKIGDVENSTELLKIFPGYKNEEIGISYYNCMGSIFCYNSPSSFMIDDNKFYISDFENYQVDFYTDYKFNHSLDIVIQNYGPQKILYDDDYIIFIGSINILVVNRHNYDWKVLDVNIESDRLVLYELPFIYEDKILTILGKNYIGYSYKISYDNEFKFSDESDYNKNFELIIMLLKEDYHLIQNSNGMYYFLDEYFFDEGRNTLLITDFKDIYKKRELNFGYTLHENRKFNDHVFNNSIYIDNNYIYHLKLHATYTILPPPGKPSGDVLVNYSHMSLNRVEI